MGKLHIVLFVISYLTTISCRSQDLTNSVPTSTLDVIATKNPCSVVITAQTINNTGGLNTIGKSYDGLSFRSYVEFNTFITINGLRLCNLLANGFKNNTSRIKFKATMLYSSTNLSENTTINLGLVISTYVDSTNLIPSVLSGTIPQIQPITLSVNNLKSASIKFGTNAYVPMNLSDTNIIVWDDRILKNSDRVRIMITFNDGQTSIYTRFGNRINAPSISLLWVPSLFDLDNYDTELGSYNIFANWSLGSDTAIESTEDCVSWTNYHVFKFEDYPKTHVIFPISTNQPMTLFRANSF